MKNEDTLIDVFGDGMSVFKRGELPALINNFCGLWKRNYCGNGIVYVLIDPTEDYINRVDSGLISEAIEYEQVIECRIRYIINKHARKAAIKELKQEGKLPHEYPDE